MSKALPEHVHPFRLAQRGESLAGSVPIRRMPRLAQMLHSVEGRVEFELQFGDDDAGQAWVLGRVGATLMVLCQRCLEPMEIRIEREVRLALVRDSAEAQTVDSAFDPLLVGEEPLLLSALVEDELILAMPDFARHGDGECTMPPGADSADESAGLSADATDGATRESSRDNPFLILESLKNRKTP